MQRATHAKCECASDGAGLPPQQQRSATRMRRSTWQRQHSPQQQQRRQRRSASHTTAPPALAFQRPTLLMRACRVSPPPRRCRARRCQARSSCARRSGVAIRAQQQQRLTRRHAAAPANPKRGAVQRVGSGSFAGAAQRSSRPPHACAVRAVKRATTTATDMSCKRRREATPREQRPAETGKQRAVSVTRTAHRARTGGGAGTRACEQHGARARPSAARRPRAQAEAERKRKRSARVRLPSEVAAACALAQHAGCRLRRCRRCRRGACAPWSHTRAPTVARL